MSDGTKSSAALTSTVSVTDTDQTPIVGGASGNVTFTQGDNAPATPIVIDSGITLSDRDNTTLTQANVVIASGFDAIGDTLLFTNDGSTMGNIVGTYAKGTLALTSMGGSATLAQWQSALRSIRFTDSAATPATTQRVVSFVVSDGTKVSASFQRAIDVVLTADHGGFAAPGEVAQVRNPRVVPQVRAHLDPVAGHAYLRMSQASSVQSTTTSAM